jgi:hypothetical protein
MLYVYPACPVEPFVLLNRGEMLAPLNLKIFNWGAFGTYFPGAPMAAVSLWLCFFYWLLTPVS